MSEEIEYPSLTQQGQNLAKFTFEVIKEAFKGGHEKLFVNAEIQKKRLDICKSCIYFDSSQGRCKSCGCYLTHKVKFSLESCPMDKWGISDEDWMNGVFEEVKEKIENPDPEVDRPRFPIDVQLGDKYSWTMPEPDSRTLHWYWNGATWEFDSNPNESVYSEEEIAAHYAERQQIIQEEISNVGISRIIKEEEEWKELMRKEREENDEEPQLIESLTEEIESNTIEEEVVEVVEEEKPKKKRGRPKKSETTEN